MFPGTFALILATGASSAWAQEEGAPPPPTYVSRQLTALDVQHSDCDPRLSPDGTRVAFVSNRTDEPDGNSNSDIWVVAADNTDMGADPVQLTAILNLHVVAGAALTAEEVLGQPSVTTLGGEVAVDAAAEGGATFGGAPIVGTDIPASNGIIHVLGAVVLP